MAGDWIKMRTDLHTDPAVIRVAAAVRLDAFAVVGRLHALWAWADAHTADGTAPGLTGDVVDVLCQCPGFALALGRVGWLIDTPDGFRIPNFDRHNGRSAKARALGARRQQIHRTVTGDPGRRKRVATAARDATVTEALRDRDAQRDAGVTREEKRREEGNTDAPPNPPVAESARTDPPPTRAPKPRKPRERNPLFDAIAEVTGTDPATAGALLGKVSAALGSADPPYTPDEVREFGRRFWQLCPWAANERDRPTPNELQTHVGKIRAGPAALVVITPPRPIDRHAARDAAMMGQIHEALNPHGGPDDG